MYIHMCYVHHDIMYTSNDDHIIMINNNDNDHSNHSKTTVAI